MQIDIFHKLKNRNFCKDLKLWIIGAIRDEGDKKLYNSLEDYIRELGLQNDITLLANLPFNEVKKCFEVAKIGIHTMKDEHFGISIIEMMAAGLITVAHKSAGPLNDIIGPAKDPVGVLALSKIIL